jgi:shikimate dehydrogenase
MEAIKLGLIGIGISRSRAPELHRLAGEAAGVTVTYDLLPPESAEPERFDAALEACRAKGYRGVNVTFPFKERAARVVRVAHDQVRRLGAVNTVRFAPGEQPLGFNTDYSGFRRAFATRFPGCNPGVAAIVGAGGVGRAIAFGLVDLKASEIRLCDQSAEKAQAVAAALGSSATKVKVCSTMEEALAGADGAINATPQGMYQYPESAIPDALIRGQSWAFDAVYTPTHTQFIQRAQQAGLDILFGYELFFYQGVDAFEIFTGLKVDEAALRRALALPQAGAA